MVKNLVKSFQCEVVYEEDQDFQLRRNIWPCSNQLCQFKETNKCHFLHVTSKVYTKQHDITDQNYFPICSLLCILSSSFFYSFLHVSIKDSWKVKKRSKYYHNNVGGKYCWFPNCHSSLIHIFYKFMNLIKGKLFVWHGSNSKNAMDISFLSAMKTSVFDNFNDYNVACHR